MEESSPLAHRGPISQDVLIWNLFVLIDALEGNQPGAGAALLASLGISDTADAALALTRVREALSEHGEMSSVAADRRWSILTNEVETLGR